MIDKISHWFLGRAYAVGTGGGSSSSGFDFQRDIFQKFSLINIGSGATAESTLGRVVGNVVTWVLAIVALIAFFYMISNGIKYITAGGDAAKATEARQGIVNGVIGIIVVVAAYLIVQFAFSLGTNIGK